MQTKEFWSERENRTLAKFNEVLPFLNSWFANQKKIMSAHWLIDSYPPSLKVFITFDGINRIGDTQLKMLTEFATYVGENGFPECKKNWTGNEIVYRFMVSFEK